MKNLVAKFRVVPQRRIAGGEKFLQNLANFLPGRTTERQKIVQ